MADDVLNAEEFQDFAAGLGHAITALKKERTEADNMLLRNKADSYEQYLQRFYKVQAYDTIIGDLENMMKRRKATL